MIIRHRLIQYLLRNPERDIVTSTHRTPPSGLRLGSRLLQKRSALLARNQRH